MKANTELKCSKHPSRLAVAVFNQRYPLCQACADEAIVAVLNQGERLCVACQGEPQALVLPISEN